MVILFESVFSECIWAGSSLYIQESRSAGFNPDPSVCRVGDDYYLVTSSFVCYPGLPVYHSKDLVNWELISYALNRPDWIDFSGINDNDGIWAPTLRYHDGKFYLITTAYHCGGNFYITATDPHGPVVRSSVAERSPRYRSVTLLG